MDFDHIYGGGHVGFGPIIHLNNNTRTKKGEAKWLKSKPKHIKMIHCDVTTGHTTWYRMRI